MHLVLQASMFFVEHKFHVQNCIIYVLRTGKATRLKQKFETLPNAWSIQDAS